MDECKPLGTGTGGGAGGGRGDWSVIVYRCTFAEVKTRLAEVQGKVAARATATGAA